MKNILLSLIVLVFIVSCSKDDDKSSNCPLNPPEWIIGTWEDELANTMEWEFMEDEIIFDQFSSFRQRFCETYENPSTSEVNIDLEELENSDSEYAFVKTNEGPSGLEVTEHYTFRKIDDNTIEFCNTEPPCDNSIVNLEKQ